MCAKTVFCILTAFGWALSAQIGGTGSIQGTISDTSGAVIPGVVVVATEVATGVKTTRQTTEAGYYVLSALPAGEYTVSATAPGFQSLLQAHVVVDALSVVGLNLTLKVGSAAEQVTVTDTPPPLNTDDARLGQTMRNEQYTALPLAMGGAPRDPTQFIYLMPGVQGGAGLGRYGNVMGGQDFSTEQYVEGLPITNSVAQGENRNLSLGISVEAVDQFQIETAGAAVEFNGQGASNFVLKSGTNRFHGAAYEYFRNTVLDARGFFASTRPPENQNEYGFNVGGPIRKNRLFFFTSYDGYKYRKVTDIGFMTLPTLAERNGNFSAFPQQIYDPKTTDCSKGPCTRQAFSNNIIPPNRISAISKYFESFLPNTVNDSIQNNYLGRLPVGYQNYSTTSKVDWNVQDNDRFTFLFSHGHRSQSGPYREISAGHNAAPLPYAETRLVDEIPTTGMIRNTYTISPALLNQFSAGYSRLWVPITNATITGQYPIKAGLTGLPAGEANSAFPEVSFAGPNVPTNWRGTNARAFTEALNTFTFQDNLQWIHGKHAVTFGVQVQLLQANEKTDAYGSVATFAFSNLETAGFDAKGTLLSATGNAYASYLLGALDNLGITDDYVVGTGGRYRDYAWWVQDNYKVTPRLTLNLGLRHDILSPYTEVKDRQSFFNPALPNPAAAGAPGILQFEGNGPNSCHCDTTIATHYGLFGPRLGFAYSLNDKTVIRGGYTIMYTHRGGVGGRGGARTGTGTLGFSANPNFTSPDSGITPGLYWDNGVPDYRHAPFTDPAYGAGSTTANPALGATMTYGDPSLGGQPPRYQNWNFGVQRALTSSIAFGAAYAGSNGHFLGGGGRGIWSDQINPKYLALGNLLRSQATPANIAAAAAIVPGVTLPYANFSGTIAQMLRPFPQYGNVSDIWGDVGNAHYNSLQVTMNKRFSKGLTFNFNYTFSKEMDDTSGSRSAYNWRTERAVGAEDQTHLVNFLFVYQLPFGKGRAWAQTGMLNAVAGGWQVSGITTYRSGLPMGPIIGSCNLPNAGSCYADYNPAFTGPVRINGSWGSGNILATNSPSFIDKNAFQSAAPYTYGNTPRTMIFGLRNPGAYNQDVSLRREFAIREGIKLAFQADAINVLNNVVFGGIGTNITSSSFGKVSTQVNSPRVIQFNARVTF